MCEVVWRNIVKELQYFSRVDIFSCSDVSMLLEYNNIVFFPKQVGVG